MDPLQKGEKWKSKIQRIINSTAAFCIAYLICVFGYYLSTALMGKFLGFDAWVYYYGVKFIAGKATWGRLTIFFTYGTGSMFLLLFSGLCIYLFYKLKERLLVINLIWLWGFVIGSSMFCTQFIMPALSAQEYNSPFYQNLAVVFAWLYLPVALVYFLAFPALALLVFFSVYSSKPFLSLSYSFSKVNKAKRKRKYFLETVFLPFIIGASAMLAFTFPLNMYVNLLYVAVIGLSLILSFFIINIQDMKVDEVLRYKTLQTINIPLLVILFLIATFIWVTFGGIFIGF
ncbi:MAG: hypothetical protein U0T73_08220 [Chitinophagales bacterium]